MMITTGLTTGIIMSTLLTAWILGSLAYNPRLFLNRAPIDMQEASPPLSKRERRDRTLLAVPLLVVSLFMPLAALFLFESTHQTVTFFERFFLLWVAMMTFNVIDLVVIDWFVVVWWQPSWTVLPNVEHLYHLNSYRFHFIAFLKGTVGITLFCLITAGVISLVV